ncbi:MAG: Kelch repeat-containing protein, partial [Bryobacteraceae bacterium]
MEQATSPRNGACAVRLNDGRVLIAGGQNLTGILDTAEFFGANGSFSNAAPMSSPRNRHTCVTLADGRVLAAGGVNENGPISLAEIYDPASNRWLPAGDMTQARAGHTATRLQDGRVLIGGGDGPGSVLNTLELFDPATNSFLLVSGVLNTPRKEHAAALLLDGRVLIAGGSDGTNALASTDLFNPAGVVVRGPALRAPRAGLSATRLLDGRVLIAGGGDGSQTLALAEIFDPATDRFFETAPMTSARRGHLAVPLPNNNQVLLIGGDATANTAELFNPWRGQFQRTGNLLEPRSDAISIPAAAEGLLLLSGGKNKNGIDVLETPRLYRFATIKTGQEQYNAGVPVMLSGSGWQPGERVTLVIGETRRTREDRTMSVTADADGAFAQEYQEEQAAPGRTYTVTASGSASQAQTHFATNPAANLDQCANGSFASPTTTCDWVNGNLNATKAHYAEGESNAYRLRLTNLVPGENFVTIEWDTTQSGKHALDYLTTYTRTVTGANPCLGVTGCGTPTTFPIPLDTNILAAGVTQVPGVFTMWGGTITGMNGGYT